MSIVGSWRSLLSCHCEPTCDERSCSRSKSLSAQLDKFACSRRFGRPARCVDRRDRRNGHRLRWWLRRDVGQRVWCRLEQRQSEANQWRTDFSIHSIASKSFLWFFKQPFVFLKEPLFFFFWMFKIKEKWSSLFLSLFFLFFGFKLKSINLKYRNEVVVDNVQWLWAVLLRTRRCCLVKVPWTLKQLKQRWHRSAKPKSMMRKLSWLNSIAHWRQM